MKRHLQTPGVRPWAGEDLIDLQNESLKTIDAFFGEYGNCIFNGVEVRPVSGNIYNITPGFVALAGTDPDGLPVYRVVPFDGAENLSLPVYLSLSYSVIEREYADQKVKPVAYDYKAVASAVRPAENTECLEITASGGRRFVDAVGLTDKLSHTGNGKDVTVIFSESENRINIASGEKMSLLWGKVRKWFSDLKTVAFSGRAADLSDDDTHRFATDTEKAVWNDKYTRADTDGKDTAALTAAQAYTDTKDAENLAAAKTYVLDRITEIVGGSPDALNTLYELAAALNNDPAFATTIMALVNGKAPLVHTHTVSQIENLQAELDGKVRYNDRIMSDNNSRTEIGYGYIENGWGYTGPAMTFGAGSDYYAQMQSDFYNLYFRACHNNVFKAWRKLAFADETPEWAKQPEKPAYTPEETGAAPAAHKHSASDINGIASELTGEQILAKLNELPEIVFTKHIVALAGSGKARKS